MCSCVYVFMCVCVSFCVSLLEIKNLILFKCIGKHMRVYVKASVKKHPYIHTKAGTHRSKRAYRHYSIHLHVP